MKHIKLFLFLSGIIAVLAFSCSKNNDSKVTGNGSLKQAGTLQGGTWNLTSIINTTTKVITNYPANVKLEWGFEQVNFSNDTISVKGLCNVGKGNYSTFANNDSITFYNGVGMTYGYCKYAEWENYLWNNLDSAYKYNINGNNLIIYSKGKYNLNFVVQ